MSGPVAEARALLAVATPGPWERRYDVDVWDPRYPRLVARCQRTGDALLIEAAPRLLAALASECERLSGELELRRAPADKADCGASPVVAEARALLAQVADEADYPYTMVSRAKLAALASECERLSGELVAEQEDSARLERERDAALASAERAECEAAEARERERAAEAREGRAHRDLEFARSIPAMDALVCTACGRTGALDGSWCWTGEAWEHHCPDAGQGGHSPAERTADALAREREARARAERRLAPLERVAEAARVLVRICGPFEGGRHYSAIAELRRRVAALDAATAESCPHGICGGDGRLCCDACGGREGGQDWQHCTACDGRGYHVCDHSAAPAERG